MLGPTPTRGNDMLEIVFVGLAIAAAVPAAFTVGRSTAPEVKTVMVEANPNRFKCPYCNVEVTGYAELDLINHVSCVGKSKADLEAEAEKRAAAEAAKSENGDTYKVTITQQKTKNKPHPAQADTWDYDDESKTYHRYHWVVNRGRMGGQIDTGLERYKEGAEDLARSAIDLDKQRFTVFEVK